MPLKNHRRRHCRCFAATAVAESVRDAVDSYLKEHSAGAVGSTWPKNLGLTAQEAAAGFDHETVPSRATPFTTSEINRIAKEAVDLYLRQVRRELENKEKNI
uniref:Uncharacterized protein n=1 Tax=Ditylenchus dipsaci TaxID=166011 RepID=A0A915ECB1_9BILA